MKDLLYQPRAYQLRLVLKNCGRIDPESIDDYIAHDGYRALSAALQAGPDTVIREITASGLRGRGGGGFPTGLKWSMTRSTPGNEKYMICNADEGDPGAYMDRSVLEGDPHAVIEGMLIAGFAIGASQGYFYIRAEYPLAIERVQKAIDQAHAYGLVGERIFGSDFSMDLEIRLGAGAFVCGEETALIASIEGKRGTPSPRPPYPSVKGLWGKPTCINNVETLANVPSIIRNGSAWFSRIGTENSKGTKVFAVTGKVRNSGLIEVPMGTTLRDIVFEIGGGTASGKRFKAVQTGGPSGGVIPEHLLDTPVDYDNLQKLGSIMGSGGMIVMDEDDCMVDIAKFYLKFCVDESCGKCAPCRIGGYQMLNLLENISRGNATLEDLERLRLIAKAMQKASLCGLGQTAANPVLSTLRYFEDEYREHILNRRCPSKKCTALLQFIIDRSRCKKCGLCARSCPEKAITGDKEHGYTIDTARCINCGMCFETCKFGAVERN
ncbi:MAG: NADH-quinone oxidoreductase subunit NuoF [Desulfobacterota bacterium]|nr:NADH-quinone oxidoreductase subunit NuoF [Thermodesulfobacteriota bacterium]